MRRSSWLHGAVAVAAGLLSAVGCAGGSDSIEAAVDEVVDQACVPGKQEACACVGGAEGVQACLADGSGYGACEGCGAGEPVPPTSSGGDGPTCGDGACDADESCSSCDADCGECVPCTAAPECDSAAVPAPDAAHRADLDVPSMTYVAPEMILASLEHTVAQAGPEMRVLAAALAAAPRAGESLLVTRLRAVLADHPASADALRRQLGRAGMGSADQYRLAFPEATPEVTPLGDAGDPMGACGPPRLRVRVASVTVHEEDDDFANDIVYCMISGEAASGAEVRVTPQTQNLDEGDTFQFSLDSGVVWGQLEPRAADGNLMLTYDCFETDSNDGYKGLIDAVAAAATEVGGVLNEAGMQGWIFQVIGAIAPVIGQAIALDSDDHLFNATQVIEATKHLELTHGGFWTVRRDGTHYNSDWDWELRMEVWGCADDALIPEQTP